MRIHIDMGDDLIERIDALAGKGQRSQFVRDAVVAALDRRARTELVLSARGAIPARGHEWDRDPAAWVRDQRRTETPRVG
jgi:Arc/MetJ-type ribon-helix-helix transcriptional regulator